MERDRARLHPAEHGSVRAIALTDPARQRLQRLPRESEFAFTTLRGNHYTRRRARTTGTASGAAGLGDVDLYTTTRHCFGWTRGTCSNSTRDIALHFGHQDGGELVRKLYGHLDARLARERIRQAFKQAPPARVPLVAAARWTYG